MDYSEPLLELKGLVRACESYALHGELRTAVKTALRCRHVAGLLAEALVRQANAADTAEVARGSEPVEEAKL